jgi:hypothetical protein
MKRFKALAKGVYPIYDYNFPSLDDGIGSKINKKMKKNEKK